MPFQRDNFIKIIDTKGDYHYGFISEVKQRGSVLTVDFADEGLSKIMYDTEYAKICGYGITDFHTILSDIEKKLISLLAKLMTTKEIGATMNMSPTTVRVHLRDLKLKLRMDTREQLIAYAQGIEQKLALNGTK